MGVQGLLSYILDSDAMCKVELSLLAKKILEETGKQPKLLFDFFNVETELWASPVPVLKKAGDYPAYTNMCGPDFHLVADRVRCFVKALRFIGIQPLFFVDAPRGCDDSFEGKLGVLKKRSEERLSDNYLMQQVLERSTAHSYPVIRCHSLVIRQVLMTLREEGAEMVFCTGEADPDIICFAQTHEETCGIVSNDSDFAITSGCVLFPWAAFDFQNLTGVRKGVEIDEKPGEIISIAITPATLAKSLHIREDQLPDLAVLRGTDYTREFIHRFSVLTALGVEGSNVEDIAKWLENKATPLMENEVMKELCLKHPELRVAIEQSYHNYALQQHREVPAAVSYASPVYELVEREMLVFAALPFAVAKRGIVWLTHTYENLTLGQPCIVDLLRPMRKTLYYLLGVREVREYGRTMTKACEVRVVPICSNQEEVEASVERLHSLRGMDRAGRLTALYRLNTALSIQGVGDVTKVVDDILKSSLEFPNMEWPKLFKLALLCCSLKLIAQLNKSSWPSLGISDSELDALLLSCLTCATEGEIPPHIVHVLPSMKAICISEWFCDVLVVFYHMTCILGIAEACPEPKSVFYPMAFVPYHLALESSPVLTARQKTDIEYVQTALKTAFSFPAVKEFRSCVFNTNEMQPLPDLISLCDKALSEVLEKAEQLLPRTMTAPLEELFDGIKLHAELEDEESDGDEAVSSKEKEGAGSAAAAAADVSAQPKEEDEKPLVWGREELPIMEHRESILELIAGHQVVCIEGETGCGKSSQVPQFILTQLETSKILASQPNLLAAKKLAERVTEELRVPPQTRVDYCDELHKCAGNPRLIYGTNGYMLEVCMCIPIQM